MANRLYKYRSLESGLNYCIDIIENNRLYFPKREQLNDPYEGNALPISLGVCGESIFASMGCYHPIVEEEMNKYRVLSLSATAISMPMWAHYAGNYNGVCFEFNRDGIFRQAQKVEYIERPFDEVNESDIDDFTKVVKNNLFYKSKHWEYEQEYRIVENSPSEFLEFIPHNLTRIFIGPKALERDDVKNGIVNLAKEKGIPLYKIFFTPRKYALSIIPIEKEIDWGVDNIENLRLDNIY